MKISKILAICIATGSMVACSSTNSDNYVEKMNQPQTQGGDSADRDTIKLNPDAWNNLDVTRNTSHIYVNKDGEPVVGNETGYLFLRGNVVNHNDKAVEIKWRCKFYSTSGMPFGDSENNMRATHEMGLGWHTMIVHPIKSKRMTDDANVIRCVSPYSKATEGKLEVHDMADDITIFNK